MLKVSRNQGGQPEIFYSIQGEGANIGQPAVFLRLGFCNLKCVWCDTKYTWDWTHYDPVEQIIELPIEQVEAEILKYNRRYLVVTGGEPLVQQDQLVPLLERIHDQQFFVEIETNGTIAPSVPLLKLVDHWSVSPKLENSYNTRTLREIPECYRLFAGLNSSHFKFVIQNEKDLQELQTLTQNYSLCPEKIILMPESQHLEILLDRSRWLVEICKTHGYRFSIRLQTLLWGNTRGK